MRSARIRSSRTFSGTFSQVSPGSASVVLSAVEIRTFATYSPPGRISIGFCRLLRFRVLITAHPTQLFDWRATKPAAFGGCFLLVRDGTDAFRVRVRHFAT